MGVRHKTRKLTKSLHGGAPAEHAHRNLRVELRVGAQAGDVGGRACRVGDEGLHAAELGAFSML